MRFSITVWLYVLSPIAPPKKILFVVVSVVFCPTYKFFCVSISPLFKMDKGVSNKVPSTGDNFSKLKIPFVTPAPDDLILYHPPSRVSACARAIFLISR